MQLHTFFKPEAIALDLPAATKSEVLHGLVALLGLDAKRSETLLRLLQRREQLGSTGFGRGIAIPHCRSLTVQHLQLVYARLAAPVDFDAIDHQPVQHAFLIVAPPLEVSNQYLPVLGRLAQFVKDPTTVSLLDALRSPEHLIMLMRDLHL